MTNIKDLARMAGVSVTTVSRVLNNHPYVSKEKRTAVLEAISESNYEQNINAVHLSKGKTQMIGVVLPFSDHPYFALLLKGIAKEALENNYKLVLFQTDYMESRELEALQMLKQKQIDSLIICSRTCDWSVIKEYLQYGRIVLCEDVNGKEVSSTFVNQYKIFLRTLEFLFQKGHEKIGYCIGRKTGPSSKLRARAYQEFLVKNNLTFQEKYIIDQCNYFEDAEKVMDIILNMDRPPTALIVTSDQVAAGIVTYCQKQGVKIPEELAIIGFHNEPIAKMMEISSIEIPLFDMGKNLLQQAISKDITNKEMFFHFIERSTV
ncbi:LacI family DNA-binding transcriptional regulator [Niallia sp. FSL W8-0635]|uniref:LacI family DNA-binding transcriptional regulator n=1 Tax=Niallia sp. FSL W8-0635 TaxID=2975337 RepID=UPI0009C570E5|nr:LacI family transcriptional regulator [Mycobacteroides abscessus subsp. abscessus]HEO8419238.1 LacI family DNA-binding transcriptional regulator [Yersinia enterocolitica]